VVKVVSSFIIGYNTPGIEVTLQIKLSSRKLGRLYAKEYVDPSRSGYAVYIRIRVGIYEGV
jgi:hypothetical protein